MFIRLLTTIVLVALLVIVLFFGEIPLGIAVSLFTVIGINELYRASKKHGNCPLSWASLLFAFPILAYTFNKDIQCMGIAVYVIAAIVFLVCIVSYKKYSMVDAVITIVSGAVVANLFYSILGIYRIGDGKAESAYILLLCLLGAWTTDIFAYLAGITFGKHKLCPEISPKKSVEGSIGGMLGVTLVITIYGYFVLSRYVEIFSDISIYAYIILGIICGILSQIGDLAASMVKRYYGIKDYGNIFPGHGGVLDRFDSLFFVAPTVYFFLNTAIFILEK